MRTKFRGIKTSYSRFQYYLSAFFSPLIYYEYARHNIECYCPSCHCPFSSNSMEYSFVYVCEERNLMYYDVPKCASSTIREEIFNNKHSFSMQNPEKELDKYFKFSFVRNPWDRMVSNWKMFTSQPLRIEQLRSMTSENLSDFETFVQFANKTQNHHWLPQFLFLPDELDFIGRIEKFDRDFNLLLATIGERQRQARKINVTKREDYWLYYKPSTVDLVAEMYSEDIKMFEYVFRHKLN